MSWVQQFNTFCFLDNHQYQLHPHTQECMLAAGVRRFVKAGAGTALQQLQQTLDAQPGWFFGHLAYDLHSETEGTASVLPDRLGFPDLYFFEPEVLIRLSPGELIITADSPSAVWQQIAGMPAHSAEPLQPVSFESRMNRQQYLDTIENLQRHILRGDCYEINFCQEFFAADTRIDPLQVYEQLSQVSPNPFSALYRLNDKWLICASPERFLKKEGLRLLSQPIKGTSPRAQYDQELDSRNKGDLYHSAKDRSENVMVVDLVRNDMSKVCSEGSVKVDELYGIYSFPQVHQMISTISGEVADGQNFSSILRATFPMGSMTGAPKRRVIQLIDQYETQRRGLFSGAVGYITPEGDFDFNVVIRSILYNDTTRYVSFPTGSGITYYSQPQAEWEECQLKAAAIKQIFSR